MLNRNGSSKTNTDVDVVKDKRAFICSGKPPCRLGSTLSQSFIRSCSGVRQSYALTVEGLLPGIPKDPFGIVAIDIWLRVAVATGGGFQLRATKALQERVGSFFLLQQTPVCPLPQSHHQIHQSAAEQKHVFLGENRQFPSNCSSCTARERPNHIRKRNIKTVYKGTLYISCTNWSQLYLEMAPVLWKEFLESFGSRAATLCSSEVVSSQTDGTLGWMREKPGVVTRTFFVLFSHEEMTKQSPYLLRILSDLSISSSKVVFTDRLWGDRSLSAAWPVILKSDKESKSWNQSLASIHSTHVVIGSDERVFLRHRSRRRKSVYDAYVRLESGDKGQMGVSDSTSHQRWLPGCCGDRSS